MVTIGEPYVERVEKALIETLILHECQTAPQNPETFYTKIKGLGFTEKVDKDLVVDSFKRLDRGGHVDKDADTYRITDDGREDVQKVENVMRQVIGRLGQGPTTTGRGVTGTPGGGTRL